jgi:hypothetical protein
MKSNVRAYTTEELLEKMRSLPNYQYDPYGWFIIGVRSHEDEFNVNDDKFYLFNPQKESILVCVGTTNPGKKGLYNFDEYNKNGVAVIKSDFIHYDLWERRMHRGKILALCQRSKTNYFRDGDKDQKTEETKEFIGNIGLNFHPQTYVAGNSQFKKFINEWSLGCQCPARATDFEQIMHYTKGQKTVTYVLLKEF